MLPANRLFHGDNLDVLRARIADESVDLSYMDPPFHSGRNHGSRTAGAFRDTWRWGPAAVAGMDEIVRNREHRFPDPLASLMDGLRPVVGEGSLLAYLVHAALRVVEVHRALKTEGSFFLHCDPTASHYLKLVLDAVFGRPEAGSGGGFRNEIAWCYSHGGRSRRWFGRKHDVIFFYSKSGQYCFDPAAVRVPMRSGTASFGGRLVEGHDGRKYRLVYGTRNSKGEARYYKYYLDEGKAPEDWWTDINSLQASSAERVGYPTQKPEALLDRILRACSRESDTVLDAYCGSGTTLVVAQRLGRRWIGIDAEPLAIAAARARLEKEFGSVPVEVVEM
jgi:DNA modification methylase